jgi:hypothetical protein
VVVNVVVVAALTTAVVPLKETTLLAGVVLKLVPVIITVAPTAPLVGLNDVNVGVPRTVKFEALLTVTPLTVKEMGPVVAPIGTDVVMEVELDALTTATVPLNDTALLAGVELKFVPVIVTVTPTAPDVGVNDEMVGVPGTVKTEALVSVTPFTVTVIFPVAAPDGTVVVREVEVAALTTAAVPLKVTTLLAGVVLKLVPVIVIVAPTAPLDGENPVMVGVGKTVKLETLVNVIPAVTTVIFPDVAPPGTVVVREVPFDEVTTAAVPLRATVGLL